MYRCIYDVFSKAFILVLLINLDRMIRQTMSETEENDTLPLLPAKPVRLNYTKRYDQVSWHSADTDFEPDPSVSSAGERRKKLKKNVYSKRRKQKLAALIIVVVIFLSVMSGLIYVYLRRAEEFVQIACGKLAGVTESVTLNGIEKEYLLYKGVPYAKPPMTNLRWRPPVPLTENCWHGIFHANSYASACVGGFNDSFHGAEDCLYLDVLTPVDRSNKPIPVVIYFGSEIFSANQKRSRENIPPLEFIAEMEIVLVNVNFRIDSLGFLSSKEIFNLTKSYGNVGLSDQIIALEWVQKNIAMFGGNPDSVTVMGKTSINALLLSPQAQDMFHKAFSSDPSPNLNVSYQQAFLQNENIFHACQSSKNVSSCLVNISAREIQQLFYSNYDGSRWELPSKGSHDKFLLVLEPNVLPFGPNTLYGLNQTANIPILIGHTAQASGLMSKSHPKTINDLQSLINEKLKTIDQHLPEEIIRLYINGRKPANLSANFIYDSITSDMRVICPTNFLLQELRKNPHHVFYQYMLMSENGSDEVVHGMDISAMFTIDQNHPTYDVGQRLRKNFKHFILYGHPDEFGWDSDKVGIFRTNGRFEASISGYRSKYCDVWNKYKNKLSSFSWLN